MVEKIRAGMIGLREPTAGDRVYRDECVYSFHSPKDEGGLFVNLRTFCGVSPEYASIEFANAPRSGTHGVYLQQIWEEVEVEKEEKEAGKLTKLGIGVEGGAALDPDVEIRKTHFVLGWDGTGSILDAEKLSLDSEEVPELVVQVARGVLRHDDAARADEVKSAVAWEFEAKESRYAKDLPLAENAKKVSPDPSSWKCAYCDLTTPLWVNLSTGVVACGRRQYDGSGGNSHALQHYEETGEKYPLCAKLGTITPEGADVYSYAADESDMVIDPLLGDHLARLGINIMKMEKTEKSMMELTLDANEKLSLSLILEADKSLEPAPGPGQIGLRNLGNSCYINSVLQNLFSLPEWRERYVEHASEFLQGKDPQTVGRDLSAQLAKVGIALVTDKYIPREALTRPPPLPQDATEDQIKQREQLEAKRAESAFVAPRMLRAVLGDGHPEFSTGRQQDAAEYFAHVLDRLAREEHRLGVREGSLVKLFQFRTEQRIKCTVSDKVRYKVSPLQPALELQIPLSDAEMPSAAKRPRTDDDKEEDGGSAKKMEPVRVDFDAVLGSWASEETIPDLFSPAAGRKVPHLRRTRIHSFPRYLAVVLQRYVVGPDWQPVKLDVEVPMPEELNLEHLRAQGLQRDEHIMEDLEGENDGEEEHRAGGGGGQVEPDEAIVMAVASMGFSVNAGKRAAIATNNAGQEAASNWVLEHMDDPDLNDDIPAPASSSSSSNEPSFDPAAVSMVMAMGFSEAHAKKALHETGNSAERAADWLLSRMDDLDTMDTSIQNSSSSSAAAAAAPSGAPDKITFEEEPDDGEGRYTLIGMVSHIGKNTGSGHYVAHVKRHGKFVFFNDRKVAISETPPTQLAYMYFYRRNDAPTDASYLFE